MNPIDKSIESAEIELQELIRLFYSQAESEQTLGSFQECEQSAMPEAFRRLLAHQHHMTVTMEQFHSCRVELGVLAARTDGDLYSRKILLRRSSDGSGVLFGIVRIDLGVLDKPVRKEIEAQKIPLGQILIDHDVLRQVRLIGLYEIKPGVELSKCLAPIDGSRLASPLYGRTAIIYCDARPVIELLEIVAA